MEAHSEMTLMAAQSKGFVVVSGGRMGEYRAILCAGSFDECFDWMRVQVWKTPEPINTPEARP